MRRVILTIVVVMTINVSAWSAEQSPEKGADAQAIRNTLEQYFKAMRERDVPAIQRLLSAPEIAVEASGQNARVELVDRDKPEQLLPPEGNKDWEELTLTDMEVQISPTHPSVAMVSFVLARELSEQQAIGMRAALTEQIVKVSEAQRAMIEKWLQNKRVDSVMFALMGKDRRDGGRWRIIAMTFPH